jgi:hypothetical protein
MSYQIAPNMRFLCYILTYNKYCCCGIPLRPGTIVSLILTIILNIGVIVLGTTTNFWENGFKLFYIILVSVQVFFILMAWMSVYIIHFPLCYYANIILQFILVIDILTLILSIPMYYGIGINVNLSIEALVIYHTCWLIYIIVATYSTYMLYSFTKTLGLSRFALRDNVSITRGNVYLPPNLNCPSASQDNWSRTSFTCEKIILTYPSDIIFAQNVQNSIVDNTVLPSGIVVPPSNNGMRWRVIGNEILLI